LAAALVTFQYAVGFYASAGARHLAKGAAGYALYHLLFVLTLALVPVFSLFELVAMLVSACVAPRFRSGEVARREEEEAGGYRRSEGPGRVRIGRGSVHSDDHLVGSDGEVRRGRRSHSSSGDKKKSGGGSRVFQRSEAAAEADRIADANDVAGAEARAEARRVRADRAAAEKTEKAEKADFVAVGVPSRSRSNDAAPGSARSGRGDGPPPRTGARSARSSGGSSNKDRWLGGSAAPVKSRSGR
jgi:hypothetical protein